MKKGISTLPTQTQKELHDLICANMGKVAFVWVNNGHSFMTKLDPLHKQQVYVGWIIRVEISKDQHVLCECETVKKTYTEKGTKFCSTCKKQIYENK